MPTGEKNGILGGPQKKAVQKALPSCLSRWSEKTNEAKG